MCSQWIGGDKCGGNHWGHPGRKQWWFWWRFCQWRWRGVGRFGCIWEVVVRWGRGEHGFWHCSQWAPEWAGVPFAKPERPKEEHAWRKLQISIGNVVDWDSWELLSIHIWVTQEIFGLETGVWKAFGRNDIWSHGNKLDSLDRKDKKRPRLRPKKLQRAEEKPGVPSASRAFICSVSTPRTTRRVLTPVVTLGIQKPAEQTFRATGVSLAGAPWVGVPLGTPPSALQHPGQKVLPQVACLSHQGPPAALSAWLCSPGPPQPPAGWSCSTLAPHSFFSQHSPA